MLGDKARRNALFSEIRLAQQGAEEANVGCHAGNMELRQCTLSTSNSGGKIRTAAGHLHQHRIEVSGNFATQLDRSVKAHTRTTRGSVRSNCASVRAEPVRRIFGGDAALQGSTVQLDSILCEPQFLQCGTCGDLHLGLHQVHLSNFLSDGVFDLDAGVHLDEDVVALLIDQELHGAGTDVTDVLAELHRIGTNLFALLLGDVLGRRNLYNLLVTTLHRAVTLEKVNDVAGRIAQDLNLDVLRINHCPLDVDPRITKGRQGLAGSFRRQVAKFFFVGDKAHTAAATTGHSFNEQRVLLALSLLHQHINIVARGGLFQSGQASFASSRHSTRLITGQIEYFRGGADKNKSIFRALASKLSIFRQEAITRVDSVRVRFLGCPQDLINIQVSLDRRALGTNTVGLGCMAAVERIAVFTRVDCNGFCTDLVCSTECANCDLATVGDQDFLKRRGLFFHWRDGPFLKKGWVNVTEIIHRCPGGLRREPLVQDSEHSNYGARHGRNNKG